MKGDGLYVGSLSTLARHGYRRASVIKKNHPHVASLRCFGMSPLLFLQRHYSAQAAAAAASAATTNRKSKKMLQYLTVLVFAMVGLTYASVPLYRRFCQATGYGGTVQRREVRLDNFLLSTVGMFFSFEG